MFGQARRRRPLCSVETLKTLEIIKTSVCPMRDWGVEPLKTRGLGAAKVLAEALVDA
jgi:hypothetical protein